MSNEGSVHLQWGDFETAEWNERFLRCVPSNLLQSYAYGEAKAQAENWKCVRALITRASGQEIGIAQVLARRFFGFATIARLNRGPLFFNEAEVSDSEKGEALDRIASCFGLRKGSFLLAAPEMSETEFPKVGSIRGLIRRSARGAHSAMLDLSPDESALRKGLNKKWRNMLGSAEKNGLAFEQGVGDAPFSWIMDRYRELLTEKGFVGIAPSLIEALRSKAPQDFLICRALHGGLPVAGIALALHGSTATYLIGYNGDAGRRLKANNFLLWNGALELKRRGLEYLDLGGLDEKNTPGVTSFKRGMGGREYRLTGEFIWF